MSPYENADSRGYEVQMRRLAGVIIVASLLNLKYRDDMLQAS